MDLNIKKKDEINYDVFLNNILIGTAHGNMSEEKEYHINFNDTIWDLSNEYNFNDFFDLNISSFSFDFNSEKFEYLDWIINDKSYIFFNYDMLSTLSVRPNFEEWNKPISLIALFKELEYRLNSENMSIDFSQSSIEEGMLINFVIDFDKTISEEYLRILNFLNNNVIEIFENSFTMPNKGLLNIFSFPDEIRQACEQYLVYFSKFLEDFGIEVGSKIDSQTKNTFFTVTPKDSEDALSKIKQLLDIYLKLPESADLESGYSNTLDVSAQQLIANVYHLKSQLYLSNSIIQMKEATIESLKLTNYQQTLLINRTNNNEEKTLDGLITIGEYEGKGFKINLAEIFRRLKRKIAVL